MSSGTYRGTSPTLPSQKAVHVDTKRGDEDPTLTRCPTCCGRGGITFEEAVVLEAEARRMDASR